MKRVICPGSFDPITNGHLDLIKRASVLFDEVIVLVAINKEKNGLFSPKERLKMINIATEGLKNVTADYTDGLLIDYMREHNVDAIVKGLRALTDFEYEFQMALTNKKLCDKCETIFLPADEKNMYLSSSIVRQVCEMGGDISQFVPHDIESTIKEKLIKN